MKEFHNFAFRCENWVIWNIGGWSDDGWISVCVTPAQSQPGVRRPALRLGWNGSRFNLCKDGARLQKIDPDAEQLLANYLAIVLPRLRVAA